MPLESGAVAIDNGPFVLYDDRNAHVCIASADLLVADTEELNMYRDIFRELDKLADYTDSAKLLIHKAMSYFS